MMLLATGRVSSSAEARAGSPTFLKRGAVNSRNARSMWSVPCTHHAPTKSRPSHAGSPFVWLGQSEAMRRRSFAAGYRQKEYSRS